MKKIFSMVIILLSTASVSYAESTSTIKYLINTPVSMMDWGMYRLEEYLKEMSVDFKDTTEWKITEIKLSTRVHYDFDENKIIIRSNPAELYFVTDGKKNAKKLCKEIVKEIRAHFMIDQENPTYTFVSKLKIDYLFSHNGYKLKGEPENKAEDLLKIMEIYSSLSYREKDDDMQYQAPQLECKTSLMSKEVYYSE